jgi:prespore-specific regulator
LERDLVHREKELFEMAKSNEKLSDMYQRLIHEHETVKEDYKTLVKIMERARKLTLFSADVDDLHLSTRFRMDANGNLERIE